MSQRITLHSTSDLRVGDAIVSIGDAIRYEPFRVVIRPLGPITPGSQVVGVHVCTPSIISGNDVLYPGAVDGYSIVIERD